MTSSGRVPSEHIAASAACAVRATVPRQPACTQASTWAAGSYRTMGTQSATRIASTVPGVAAVNLGSEDEVGRAGAEGGRGPAPVLAHVRRVVADREAEVERGVAARRYPAVAGGDHGLDRQRV